MLDLHPSLAPLHSLLFQLREVELVHSRLSVHHKFSQTAEYTLLIFRQGHGFLHSDSASFSFLSGKCYLLSPSASFQIENTDNRLISFYQVTFTTIHLDAQNKPEVYLNDLLPGRIELTAHPVSRLTRLTNALDGCAETAREKQAFAKQLHFQELIGFLLEQNQSDSAYTLSTTQEVENTLGYIQQNYQENISVAQLAALAHVPPWQYTPLFRKLTGKKPLEYVTELRIQHAKKLLVSSDDSLREIATQVGFADEYYFNRRFRQTTGYSPRQYSRLTKNKTIVQDWTGHEVEIPVTPQRIVYVGETFNDLLALQVETIVGGTVTWLEQTLYPDKIKDVQDITVPLNPADLIALNPDLIIYANSDESRYNQICEIAPTLTFNSFASLDRRLTTLGDWLGKKAEAKHWLERYEEKAAAMWQQLRSVLATGETASVFIHDHGERLFVMGSSGFSTALYHPCGFSPGEKIQEVLLAGEGFWEISEAVLPAYAGDRIFMLLSDKPHSRRATQKLLTSELWKSLPAVQNGHVYLVEAKMWNYGAALARESLLDVLPRLLCKSS